MKTPKFLIYERPSSWLISVGTKDGVKEIGSVSRQGGFEFMSSCHVCEISTEIGASDRKDAQKTLIEHWEESHAEEGQS